MKAAVREISDLSAHADQNELITWLKAFTENPKRVFLVHGEPSAQEALRVKIKDELNIKATILQQDRQEFMFAIRDKQELNAVAAEKKLTSGQNGYIG